MQLAQSQQWKLQQQQQQQQQHEPQQFTRSACHAAPPRTCVRKCSIIQTKATTGDRAPAYVSPKPVHDGRMPFWRTLEGLFRPRDYLKKVQNNHPFAWGNLPLMGPSKDAFLIADMEAAQSIGAAEMQLGVVSDFPQAFRDMLGNSSISLTRDLDLHARLRQVISVSFTKEAIQQLLPQLQQTAAVHLERWADAPATGTSNGSSATANEPCQVETTADGSIILAYPAVRLLTFDVLVNCVMGLQMSEAEVQQYEALFKDLIGGFVPPAWDAPFTPYGKGLKAREQVVARVIQTLSSPQCSGALARLRDEFGADSPEAVDNTINVMFAGFDTTSSTLSYMLFLLTAHPDVLEKVDAEQAAVVSKYGPTLNPAAYATMPYTMAVIKETLRLAQIIPNVPRLANKELAVPGGPTLHAGCPFLVNLEAISKSDPAIQQAGDWERFKPERWLDPDAAKFLSQYQLPFGTGQRTCLGTNLAYAEMAAVLAELSRHYTFAVEQQTDWQDFPIKRPTNNLPMHLTRKATAAAEHAQAASARQARY